MESGERPKRSWLRPAGLFGLAVSLSVSSVGPQVSLAYLAMVAFLRPKRSLTFAVGLLLGTLVFAGGAGESIWFVERGWGLLVGGWFVALTLWRPAAGLLARAIGAVFGASLATIVVVGSRPGGFAWLDWVVDTSIQRSVANVVQLLAAVQGEGGLLAESVLRTLHQTAAQQVTVFPALTGLASLCAIGVAWWLFVRLEEGAGGGLGRLAEFRFNDHLVWVLIGGVGLRLLGPEGAWERVGLNLAVFMGALYAFRGLAVLRFLKPRTSVLGVVLVVLAVLLAGPVVAVGAVIVGLADTWLDVRTRAASDAAL